MGCGGKLCSCFKSKSRFSRILIFLIVANAMAAVAYLCKISHQNVANKNVSRSQDTSKPHKDGTNLLDSVRNGANKLYKTMHGLNHDPSTKHQPVRGHQRNSINHGHVAHQSNRIHNGHAAHQRNRFHHGHAAHQSNRIHHGHIADQSNRFHHGHAAHRSTGHHYNHYWKKVTYHPRKKHHRHSLYIEDWKDSVMKVGEEYHVAKNGTVDYTSLRRNTSSDVMFDDVAADNPHVMLGGRFKPRGIRPRSKVAIIIPYRRRWFHLRMLLHRLHPILQKQGLEYGIFIVHQRGEGLFNKASLMNVGYLETSKSDDYKCFIFHDVDLLPENYRCLYTCSETTNDPRHIATAISKYGYHTYPGVTIGGISAFNRRQIESVNGWSNQYHGWGGEDDDMARRIQSKHMRIRRPTRRVCRFTSLPHGRDKGNPFNTNRWRLLRTSQQRMSRDGLNTIKYRVAATKKFATYTNISVELL